jgi:hypothetical protein
VITEAFQWTETRLDEGGWIRRIYLLLATAMTWKYVLWAMSFATTSPRAGSDVAMIIAAVGVPIAAVQTFAFNAYLDSRKPQSGTASASTTTSTVEITK